MTLSFTGHRPHKLGNDYELVSPLIKRIKAELMLFILDKKATHLITGLAVGIDTLVALIAIELNMKYTAAIPCSNQDARWPQRGKDIYNTLINHELCTKHYCSNEPATPYCWDVRDRWMVDNGDELVAVWDGTAGGTANTVNYAVSLGKTITIIDPNNYR